MNAFNVLYLSYASRGELSRAMFRETLFADDGDAPDENIDPFLSAIGELFESARARGELAWLPSSTRGCATNFFAAYAIVLIAGLRGRLDNDVPAAGRAADWSTSLRELLELQVRAYREHP